MSSLLTSNDTVQWRQVERSARFSHFSEKKIFELSFSDNHISAAFISPQKSQPGWNFKCFHWHHLQAEGFHCRSFPACYGHILHNIFGYSPFPFRINRLRTNKHTPSGVFFLPFAFLFPARLSEAIRHTLLDLNSISARSVNKNQPDIWK